ICGTSRGTTTRAIAPSIRRVWCRSDQPSISEYQHPARNRILWPVDRRVNAMTDGAERDNRLLTGSEFFSRAQERLTFNLPAALTNPDAIVRPSDAHGADPAALAAIAAVRPIRPAAVLVPVVQRNEPSVLFTERTARLADHGGEISFP